MPRALVSQEGIDTVRSGLIRGDMFVTRNFGSVTTTKQSPTVEIEPSSLSHVFSAAAGGGLAVEPNKLDCHSSTQTTDSDSLR